MAVMARKNGLRQIIVDFGPPPQGCMPNSLNYAELQCESRDLRGLAFKPSHQR